MQRVNNKLINISILNNSFLNSHRICFLSNSLNTILSGTGISNKSNKLAILASMGEFFEREAIMIGNRENGKRYKGNMIKGYSFIQSKEIDVDIEKVLVIEEKNNFIDSCALASYTDSKNCINNALGEFIERQSYILNYLSKGKCKKIDITNEKKFQYVLKKIPTINFYDISLINEYHVILSKGIYNNKFYIGLGGDRDLDTAFFKCIKETLIMDYTKNPIDNKKKEKDYIDLFLTIPCKKLDEYYRYLDKNSITCFYSDIKSISCSIDEIIKSLNYNYKMDPIIFYINSSRNINTLKIVKILDLKWFPNLCPKTYNDDTYLYVEKITGEKLDRKCNFLPFP